jgi:hypothetical protein
MQSIVFAIPAYFMIHFEYAAEKFFVYLISLILAVLTMTYTGTEFLVAVLAAAYSLLHDMLVSSTGSAAVATFAMKADLCMVLVCMLLYGAI